MIRGLVLKGHNLKGHWLVHWFYLGKTAAVPVGRLLCAPPNADLVQKQHVENFLKNLDKNYIGDAEDLKRYINNGGSTLTTTTIPTVSLPAKSICNSRLQQQES